MFDQGKIVPLVNQLNTGKSQTEIVKNALESIFDKPTDFYRWFNDKQDLEIIKNKVVSMEGRSTKRLSDTFKERFEE
jgi:hypothetical protein